jgi:hypothetical protein
VMSTTANGQTVPWRAGTAGVAGVMALSVITYLPSDRKGLIFLLAAEFPKHQRAKR